MNKSLGRRSKSLLATGAVLGSLGLGVSSVSLPALAVGCPCNYMAWYTVADTMLGGIKTATSAAMQSLNTMQDTLDETLTVGLQTERTAIENSGNNIVSAVEAQAMTFSTAYAQANEVEARLLEALRTALEQLGKSSMVAEHNRDVANNFGPENVSHATNTTAGLQLAEIITIEPGDTDPGTEAESQGAADSEESVQVSSVDFMLETVQERQRQYVGQILTEQEDNQDFLSISGLFRSNLDPGFQDTVVPAAIEEEAIAVRRFMAVPPGVQTGLQDVNVAGGGTNGYQQIVQRAKVAAEFLAWDLAIRSEIETSEGSTSLLHFLETSVETIYSSTEGMEKTGTANRRELLNTVATNQALSNLLDMIEVELGAYQNNLEAAKIGFYNDEAFNPVTGYNQFNLAD